MATKKISIIGCGWLGKPLAQFLIQKGFEVRGTTSSSEKVPLLKSEGMDAIKLTCTEDGVIYEDSSFFDADVLVVNIPPRRATGFDYPKSMGHLAREVAKYPVKRVVFISATSVYPDQGKLVCEDDATPSTERSKTLLDAENHFLKNPVLKTTVLRLSGLIGPGRVPGVTKRNVSLADGPVNLIHLDDCLAIIHQLIIKNPKKGVYNASCPEHPLRSELYAHIKGLGYETIQVLNEVGNSKKRVSSQRLMDEFGYTFKYKNPLGIGEEGYASWEL